MIKIEIVLLVFLIVFLPNILCYSCPFVLSKDPVFKAIQTGNIIELKKLIHNDVNINISDKHGITPLLHASGLGHQDIVQLLLEKGVDINYQTKDGITALTIASIDKDNIETISLLIKKGANVNAKGRDGYSLLHRASKYGYFNVVNFLIDNGAELNIEDSYGYTPLELAENFLIHIKEGRTGHIRTIQSLKKAQKKRKLKRKFILLVILIIVFSLLRMRSQKRKHINTNST
jgi:hypothetical protein